MERRGRESEQGQGAAPGSFLLCTSVYTSSCAQRALPQTFSPLLPGVRCVPRGHTVTSGMLVCYRSLGPGRGIAGQNWALSHCPGLRDLPRLCPVAHSLGTPGAPEHFLGSTDYSVLNPQPLAVLRTRAGLVNR